MAFIAIDAKADVANSKKGKLTPAQHAQLNAWCLASKTGILDWGDKCVSTAASYSVSDGAATVIFKKGYLVICGRIVECEANTQVAVSAPISGSVSGKIILRYNLSNSGNDEFVVTTTTSALTQQDLNDNPLTGVYEFELYSYSATPTTVTLTRTNTDYIPDIGGKLQQFITVLTGTGMTGTGNPPLQGYNKGEGTIEVRFGTIEERLSALGFREGSISTNATATQNTLKRQGNYVFGNFSAIVGSQPVFPNITALTMSLPENFRPSSVFSCKVVATIRKAGSLGSMLQGVGYATITISTSGGVSFSDTHAYDQSTAENIDGGTVIGVECNFGFEASPIQP